MPDQEAIDNQLNLLRIYRRNLALYLGQKAMHGAAFVLPSINNGIIEARENIKKIKEDLREWDVAVEDEPNDNDPSLKSGIHTNRSQLKSREIDKSRTLRPVPQVYNTEHDAEKLKEGFKRLINSLVMLVTWILVLIVMISLDTFLSANIIGALRIFLVFFILFIIWKVILACIKIRGAKSKRIQSK